MAKVTEHNKHDIHRSVKTMIEMTRCIREQQVEIAATRMTGKRWYRKVYENRTKKT